MAVSLLDALPWRIGSVVDRSLQPTTLDNSVSLEKAGGSEKLVVLLGWGGALQKHLSKIRKFYLAANYAVVSYISPMSCFLQGGLIEKDIDELVEIIQQEVSQAKDQHFHVHLHSNNGVIVWGALLLALRESAPQIFPSLTGIVFDSAPRMDPKPPGIFWQALGFTFPCIPIMLRRNQYIHPVWTPALFVFFLIKLISLRLLPQATRRFTFAKVREIVLHEMPSWVPQLYIYSKADRLISSNSVEDYILRQKRRGTTITTKVFADTPHVQHYLKQEAEYQDALLAFLECRRP